MKNWTITTARKADLIDEFDVPCYRLDGKALDAFLKAVVSRFSTEKPQGMVEFYLNRRAGKIERRLDAEVSQYFNFELRRIGRFCGSWECYAIAWQQIDEKTAEAIQQLHNVNRGAK